MTQPAAISWADVISFVFAVLIVFVLFMPIFYRHRKSIARQS